MMKLKIFSILGLTAVTGISLYAAGPSLFAQEVTEPIKPTITVTQQSAEATSSPISDTTEIEGTSTETSQLVEGNQPTTTSAEEKTTEQKSPSKEKATIKLEALSKEEMTQIILRKAGIQNQTGLTIVEDEEIDNCYQIEIRMANEGDGEVLTMVGLYRYDIQTGTVSKQDYLTGEYHAL